MSDCTSRGWWKRGHADDTPARRITFTKAGEGAIDRRGLVGKLFAVRAGALEPEEAKALEELKRTGDYTGMTQDEWTTARKGVEDIIGLEEIESSIKLVGESNRDDALARHLPLARLAGGAAAVPRARGDARRRRPVLDRAARPPRRSGTGGATARSGAAFGPVRRCGVRPRPA